jgi:hypothetical protein
MLSVEPSTQRSRARKSSIVAAIFVKMCRFATNIFRPALRTLSSFIRRRLNAQIAGALGMLVLKRKAARAPLRENWTPQSSPPRINRISVNRKLVLKQVFLFRTTFGE